jgi:hypothetical protein
VGRRGAVKGKAWRALVLLGVLLVAGTTLTVWAQEVTVGFGRPGYEEREPPLPPLIETVYGLADRTDPQEEPTEWNSVAAAGYPEGGTYSYGKRSGPGDIIWHQVHESTFATRTTGTYTFSVSYQHELGSASARSGNFVIFTGDLIAQGVDEDDEEIPGAFVGLAEKDYPRKMITLQAQNLSGGKMWLEVADVGNNIEIWTAAEDGDKLYPNDHEPWEPDPLEFDAGTRNLYVEGVDLSSGPWDVRLTLKAKVEEHLFTGDDMEGMDA